MKVTYHPRVQNDITQAMSYYEEVAGDRVADDFWEELITTIEHTRAHPTKAHFADCGMRRVNLSRFPFHFLYELLDDRIRIIVVRHHKRSPSFGTKRKWR